eukprot:CAMPEP_0170531550 /NCGR_PEP_ID=MMETSP0209-20121228/62900_1 /TAXON_ID=665100 ORGANISM="Litonotus pictus, Strain P1" /NCGR_SAMPLE_ID=MMETSP0209 /ASSEMBLY_ACC=CAM_ASM_000301 /LENGTH=48 /DNA_ID= /DNA_START= /DNA_END= /DNA_ORIENTATION=
MINISSDRNRLNGKDKNEGEVKGNNKDTVFVSIRDFSKLFKDNSISNF